MSFKIDADFVGGNIDVLSIEGDRVVVERQLRDTAVEWFYWAFRVTGAAGRTLTFEFDAPKSRLGFYGPAVSHDLEHFTWLDSRNDEKSFTYTFGEDEDVVYFTHHMLYRPERFLRYAAQKGLEVGTLCEGRLGSAVPMVEFGEGERTIVLTARHHCCESTGNYVLEGVLDSLVGDVPTGYRVLCVPFVDYDGVVAGDQGKERAPHDHNRDYIDNPIYPETKALMAYMNAHPTAFLFDFHSPFHKGGSNDYPFIVKGSVEKMEKIDRMGDLFAESITEDSMAYRREWDLAVGESWVRGDSPTSAHFANGLPGAEMAFTLETTYFGRPGVVKFSEEGAIALGKSFAAALKKYIRTMQDT